MKREDLGSIENSRTSAQMAHMQDTVGKGICPFCKIDLAKNKLIGEWAFWNVWENPFPYDHHERHIIIAAQRHITSLEELTGGEALEWLKIVQWAEKHFDIPGGGLVKRFGDPKRNAGTVAHFHWHIQVPKPGHTTFALFSKGPNWPQILELLKAE